MKLIPGSGTYQMYVTPRVGVWIETRPPLQRKSKSTVTPRVGVWIETHRIELELEPVPGHPPRGGVD